MIYNIVYALFRELLLLDPTDPESPAKVYLSLDPEGVTDLVYVFLSINSEDSTLSLIIPDPHPDLPSPPMNIQISEHKMIDGVEVCRQTYNLGEEENIVDFLYKWLAKSL